LIDVANGKQKNVIVPALRAAFAERIRALRAAAGLTQTELARRADIDRSYYAEVDRLGEGRQSGSRRRLSRQNSLPSGSARTCQDASAG
jgi:ribosome-binding protein aMBF1 (putative translation factor)